MWGGLASCLRNRPLPTNMEEIMPTNHGSTVDIDALLHRLMDITPVGLPFRFKSPSGLG